MASAQRKTTQQLIDEREQRERRIILIGKTGHGKSSSGNSICADKIFPTSAGTASFTKHYRAAYRTFDGMDLIVYDTPGLFDTKDDLNTIKTEISLAIRMASPGPHAFLIHFKIGNKFTDEEKKTIEYIQDIFGEDAHKYCILVLTGEDNLIYDGGKIEDYLQNAESGLKRLLEQCHNRYIVINNRSQQQQIDERVRQLLKLIETMLLNNQTRYYTNEQFEKAEQELQEREKKQLEVEIQKREANEQVLGEKISQKFQEREKQFEKEKEELEKLVKDLRQKDRDEANTQQRLLIIETVCKTIPLAINAVTSMIKSYFETNQNSNEQHFSLEVPKRENGRTDRNQVYVGGTPSRMDSSKFVAGAHGIVGHRTLLAGRRTSSSYINRPHSHTSNK